MPAEENTRLIESLNQRGGRMMSLHHLLQAGTLNLKAAAFLVFMMERNPSFLSCAGAGGAGKTTLMGALLMHLPDNIPITPYGCLAGKEKNACIMAHEINDAPYEGYIRGSDVRIFLRLPSNRDNVSVCATVHADSTEELAGLLPGVHGAAGESVHKLDFLVFPRILQIEGRNHVAKSTLLVYNTAKNR